MKAHEVAEAFGVSYNTVVAWTERSDDPLPVRESQRGFTTRRRFDSEAVKAWADRNGLAVQIS